MFTKATGQFQSIDKPRCYCNALLPDASRISSAAVSVLWKKVDVLVKSLPMTKQKDYICLFKRTLLTEGDVV